MSHRRDPQNRSLPHVGSATTPTATHHSTDGLRRPRGRSPPSHLLVPRRLSAAPLPPHPTPAAAPVACDGGWGSALRRGEDTPGALRTVARNHCCAGQRRASYTRDQTLPRQPDLCPAVVPQVRACQPEESRHDSAADLRPIWTPTEPAHTQALEARHHEDRNPRHHGVMHCRPPCQRSAKLFWDVWLGEALPYPRAKRSRCGARRSSDEMTDAHHGVAETI